MLSRAKPYLWLGIIILAALAFSVETYSIRSAWPPQRWPFSDAVPFVTPLISNARGALFAVMASSFVWSAAYVILVREQLTNRSFSWLGVIAMQVVASVIVLCAAIPFNSDQYIYVSHANLVLEGLNPYAPPLRSAISSPQLQQISTVWSIDEGSPDAKERIAVRARYGPLWELASAAMLWPFTHATVEVQSRVLRFFAALAALACTAVIWITLRDHAWRSAATAAFALNPVILQQTALGAHNDIYGLLLALLAALALTRKHEVLAAFLLGASIALKLTFVPFLPALVVYIMVRRGLLRGSAGVVAALLPIVLCALPFGLGSAIVQPIKDLHEYNSPYILSFALALAHHIPGLHDTSASWFESGYIALVAICGLSLAAQAARLRRAPLLEAGLLLLIFCGAHFEPWYAVGFAPLLLIPGGNGAIGFIALTVASLVFEGGQFISIGLLLPFVLFVLMATLGFVILKRFYRLAPSNDPKPSPLAGYAS